MPPNQFFPRPGQTTRPPFQMMGGQQFRQPFPMSGQHQTANPGGGNILSKLLQGFRSQGNVGSPPNISNAIGGFQRASESGSVLKGLTDPGKLQSILSNTQQVLKTAQQVGPLIQQYGPLVKNLPSMWKLYKGLKDAPDNETETDDHLEKEEKKKETTTVSNKANKEDVRQPLSTEEETNEQSEVQTGQSIPKLYI